MKEYDKVEAGYYDFYARGVEGDVEFYVEKAQKTMGPVLELGCGTGRILIPIAEAGVRIVGLDQSSQMLSVARQKVKKLEPETQQHIELIEGDMRDFSLERHFELIMIPFRAFLHLMTPEDQRQGLACIRRHLTDNGRLIFNIFDPRLETIVAHRESIGRALKKNAEFVNSETGRRVVSWETRQYNLESQQLRADFIFEELDDDGVVVSKAYTPLTLRFVYRYEMQYLLELCGYKIEALYGDFRRGPFRAGGEQVWVVRKA